MDAGSLAHDLHEFSGKEEPDMAATQTETRGGWSSSFDRLDDYLAKK
jgi:hypothetical protein